MGDEPRPLAPEDRGILDLEGPTIAGHTCKVVSIAGATDRDALRAAVAERLVGAPLLMRRLGGTDDLPAWVVDDAFDVREHVERVEVDAPLGREELRAEVARLFEQRLDRGRPLWKVDLVATRTGTALVWRIHHALADGTTAMRYARALLWDPAAEAEAEPARAASHDEARRRRHLAGFLHRELSRSRGGSPFDGRIGRRREIGLASTSLPLLHDAARSLAGATLNDAVLSVVAGGLRRWLIEHHGPLGDVRARVPVSLHHDGDDAGNRDSFFSVALPLDEPDPVVRLRAVREATTLRKDDRDAETMDALLRELTHVPPRLRDFAQRVEASPRRFAVSVSNVPGPRRPVRVLGAPVRALHSIAEIGERHALRVAAVSMGDMLCFGFCADPGIVDGVEQMAAGAELEAAALVRAAQSA